MKPKTTKNPKGAGAPKKTDKLNTTVSFRIKEAWREPVKVAVRAAVKKLKKKG